MAYTKKCKRPTQIQEILTGQGDYLPPKPIQKIFDEEIVKFRLDHEQKKIDLKKNWEKELKNNLAFRLQFANEDLLPMRRNKIHSHLMLKENDEEDAIFEAKLSREMKQRSLEQEQRLAKELQKRKEDDICQEKRRQQLFMNSVELRKLEQDLKTAYYRRESALQMQEMEKKRQQEMMEKKKENALFENEMIKNKEELLQYEQELLDTKLNYKKDLEKQHLEKEYIRQREYEEFLRDKLLIDEIVRKIYDEDEKILQDKMKKMNKTKQEINDFLKEKQVRKQKEKEKMEEENRKIQEFLQHTEEKSDSAQDAIRQKEEQLEKLRQKIGEKIYSENMKKLNLQTAREELATEQLEEANRLRDQKEKELKIQSRLHLKKMFMEQLEWKAEMEKQKKWEEEAWRQKALAQFAEEERQEQINAEIRCQKQHEYRRIAEKLIEDKRAQYALQKEQELAEWRELEEMENIRMKMVEEERLKLLKRHAETILGFVPRGMFKNQQEYEAVCSNARESEKTVEDEV